MVADLYSHNGGVYIEGFNQIYCYFVAQPQASA
jgi:hypothetical protein